MSQFGLIKLVSLFLYPLGFSVLLAVLGGVFSVRGLPRTGRALILSALVFLWICSTPVVSNALQGALERRYDYQAVEDVSDADLIVILGGGAFGHDTNWPYPDIRGSADRYWHGARLFHAGRGQMVLISGARDLRRPAGPSEAQLGAAFLVELSVPADKIILDNVSKTTQEHVSNVAQLLQEHDVESFLLVTSAIHLRRAEAVFRAGGLDPIPVATDFKIRKDVGLTPWHFIPSVQSLAGSTAAIHEYFGYWFYRIRGLV